jgi:hypothetical protein
VKTWIKKIWYAYTMEWNSALKNKGILSFVITWMNLEDIILSEVIQEQEDKQCMISLICEI